ncbi:MAG: hypothetical protein ACLP5V_11435 [Candidatus Bathyarchaeia archaeon]
MAPKAVIVTCLFLAIAVLAFAGLGYQQVPISTTRTMTQVSVRTVVSYSPFLATNILTYTTTDVQTYTSPGATGIAENCAYPNSCCPGNTYIGALFPSCASTATSSYTFTIDSTYETENTATTPYSQTLTGSTTESSTSLVPVSATLGLTDGSFTMLAVVVIGILALLTAYVTLKPRTTHGPKQATLSQSAQAPSPCIKFGAAIPLASEFCNKC